MMFAHMQYLGHGNGASHEGVNEMNGRAMIIGGKLAISHNGSIWVPGVRFIRDQIKKIEASKSPIKASTYVTLASYKAAVTLWDNRNA